MAKITDVQIRRLFRLLGQETPLLRAAQKVGIDPKTAKRYRDMKQLPSGIPPTPRTYRTRLDPFAGAWAEIEEQLRLAPGLQVKALWDWLLQKYPGTFD